MARTIWIDTLLSDDIAASGQLVKSLMSGVSSVQTRFDSMTLLRTIVGLDLAYTVHDAGEGSGVLDIGIGVTTQEAFNASVVPDPNVETDFPTRGWIYRSRYRVFGFAADQPAVYSARVDKDIRSRRKLDNGECYIVANWSIIEGASATVKVLGLLRQLWLVM